MVLVKHLRLEYYSQFIGLVLHHPGAADEVDLLQAITIPFEDPKHVYFAEGDGGRTGGGEEGGFVAPSFGIRSGSNIMTPFGLLYGDRDMFERFEISAKVKPADDQGSVGELVDEMG